MEDFFQKYVWRTNAIEYNSFFKYVGMKMEDIYADYNSPYLGAYMSNGKIILCRKRKWC